MSIKTRAKGQRRVPFLRYVLSAAAVLATFLPLAARAEYRLDVGDVIEVSVLGMPDLKMHAKVSLDGNISFPLLGQMHVVGETMAELRENVAKLLPNKYFRHKGIDGHDDVVVIDPDQVSIDIFEYRPVYVNGDVSKPGEQAYRPGMTALQAITLAGGYDLMHMRMESPFLQSADLDAEYKNLLLDFVQSQAHVLRLKAELDGKSDFDRSVLTRAPIAPDLAERVADMEARIMAARGADAAQERAFYKKAIDEAERQLALLVQEQQKAKNEADADSSDMQRLRGLFAKGLVPITQISQQRRDMVSAETQFLQTSATITQVTRDRNDLGRKLQQVDEQRRMEVLKELQDAEVKFVQLRPKLQAVGEKLLYTGTVKSQLVRGTGGKPSVTISRKERDGRVQLAAKDDTELLPGDVLEVTLRAEYAPNVASQ